VKRASRPAPAVARALCKPIGMRIPLSLRLRAQKEIE
jgi:hypothetical protein